MHSSDLIEPRCSQRQCRWLQGVKERNDSELTQVPYCPAFPDGIPDSIAYGEDPHTEVHPDQVREDVLYEKATL